MFPTEGHFVKLEEVATYSNKSKPIHRVKKNEGTQKYVLNKKTVSNSTYR